MPPGERRLDAAPAKAVLALLVILVSAPPGTLAAGGARIVRDRAGEVIALDFNRGPLADRTVPALSRFPKLRQLVLRNTPLTDAALLALDGAPLLEFLDLAGTGIGRRPGANRSLAAAP